MEIYNEDTNKILSYYKRMNDVNEERKANGEHDYSLLNSLLKITNEVNLHSNFIYSMINPKGQHYCGDIYLKSFLKVLGLESFRNINRVNVHKEKDKIDLLIEDGEKFIIIENKLRAEDQKHQISRYIQKIYADYLNDENKIDTENITVVYLSQYKKQPSKKSESIKGFKLEKRGKDTFLQWQNEEVSLNNKTKLKLPKDSKIRFKHVKHSDELYTWTEECIKNKKINKPDIVFSFGEYKKILDRLKNNNWRIIMGLDEYMLKNEFGIDEELMYNYMVESAKILNSYKGKKIFRFFEENNDFINKRMVNNSDIWKDKVVPYREFTEKNCTTWFKKGNQKKYRNIAFKFTFNDTEYYFGLGIDRIACGEFKKDSWDNSIVGERRDSIFKIISEIEKKLKIDIS